jgi:hypothetical protein
MLKEIIVLEYVQEPDAGADASMSTPRSTASCLTDPVLFEDIPKNDAAENMRFDP